MCKFKELKPNASNNFSLGQKQQYRTIFAILS